MSMTSDTSPIPIGSIVPLSGPSTVDGIEFRNGIILAAEEINAQGGILGRPVKPIFIDSNRQSADMILGATRRLLHEFGCHAIICGYNIGPQNSEYEAIADAGVIYIHTNTLVQHHDTVLSNRDRYFGCFMSDPPEYWYGQGFVKFITWLKDTGQWTPRNNRMAIVSGSKPYSIVIANAMASAAREFGWVVSYGPKIVSTPTTEWSSTIEQIRAADPAVIANTHFYVGDLASFQRQFVERPVDALVYLQYGAMHEAFSATAGPAAEGIIVGTVIGLIPDALGNAFAKRYYERFGEDSTPNVGCQTYSELHHYALAAAAAGGTAGPGGFEQNRKVAERLRSIVFRSVAGAICYHPVWQSAIPFPNQTNDPSLGMPHLFFQLQNKSRQRVLIAPDPYRVGRFKLPPWFSAELKQSSAKAEEP